MSTSIEGRVTRQDKKSYHVHTDQGELVARAPPYLRPAVGEQVLVTPVPPARITAILPRRTALTRIAPDGHEQVIAANVDVVLVLAPLDRPVNERTIERYLAAIAGSGARAVVLLTKADAAPAPGLHHGRLLVSAQTGAGLADVQALLSPGVTIALVGPSGAGKSTLINALLGEARLATGDVRAGDHKGRHTTTWRELVRLPNGAWLLDTPGLRELALSADADVDAAFDDIAELARSCKFSDCHHETEPGCAVRAVVRADRLASYQKLAREAASAALRADPVAYRKEARAWGRRGRDAMQEKRDRWR